MPTVLLVDDDPELASLLSDTLGAATFRIWHVMTASAAEVVLDQTVPDLILLDLVLPDRNGLVLCADLKGRLDVPIIICSATRRKDDAALGLRLGAADFVAKPFSLDDLQDRMEAALQRVAPPAPPGDLSTRGVQQLGALVINQAECRVMLRGEALDVTPTEYRLLCVLAARPNQVISRRELADATWGEHDGAIVRTLGVHLRRLRAKIASAAPLSPRLVCRRGFGYELACDDL